MMVTRGMGRGTQGYLPALGMGRGAFVYSVVVPYEPSYNDPSTGRRKSPWERDNLIDAFRDDHDMMEVIKLFLRRKFL